MFLGKISADDKWNGQCFVIGRKIYAKYAKWFCPPKLAVNQGRPPVLLFIVKLSLLSNLFILVRPRILSPRILSFLFLLLYAEMIWTYIDIFHKTDCSKSLEILQKFEHYNAKMAMFYSSENREQPPRWNVIMPDTSCSVVPAITQRVVLVMVPVYSVHFTSLGSVVILLFNDAHVIIPV